METIDESIRMRRGSTDRLANGNGCETEWSNRLILGDNRHLLPSLLPEFAGKVDLIYIDPPFSSGANYTFTTTIPASEYGDTTVSHAKETGAFEQKAYRDNWGTGTDSYLKWFHDTVSLLRELLTPNGSIYVHLDWHIGHYAKAILDEVFGADCFQNEIAWCYREAINSTRRWNRKHDNLLYYTRNAANFCFNANAVLQPHSPVTVAKYRYEDENGRYRLMGRGITGSPIRSARDVSPEWEKTHPELVYRHYLRAGTYPVDYLHIDIINQSSHERVNYPTQKPEALLSHLLKASSNEGDLVLDCFCGSGTTAVVAEKSGRRWIACDLSRFAIHTARKRLLAIEEVRPFVIQNQGKYERQAWQAAASGSAYPSISRLDSCPESSEKQVRQDAEERTLQEEATRRLLLELYRALPISGYTWLHGAKNDKVVHIGSVNAPVSSDDLTQIALEFHRVVGSDLNAPLWNGIDVLGWEFASEVTEIAGQHASHGDIPLRFIRIPPEMLEKQAIEQNDIRFLDLATLSVDAQTSGMSVTLKLTDFNCPLADVPEAMRCAVTHWSQWIDYWAVDWEGRAETFHNRWRAYRTRKSRSLTMQAATTYTDPGIYRIVVKVFDILGNETMRTLQVQID